MLKAKERLGQLMERQTGEDIQAPEPRGQKGIFRRSKAQSLRTKRCKQTENRERKSLWDVAMASGED